jgi:hypothetical protein
MPKQKRGKFWPPVRARIWEKAQQLFQEEQATTMGTDFKGITATRQELWEGGYFYQAKLIVLRDLWLQKKGHPTSEEEAYIHEFKLVFSKPATPGRTPNPRGHRIGGAKRSTKKR